MQQHSAQTAETCIAAKPTSHATEHPKLKFNGSDRFLRELRRRVDVYFEQTGHRRRDCAQMYFKTATILAWFFGAYFLLLFVATSWWMALPLAVILGVAMAAIGFNIQHDAGHNAYSDRSWVNKVMALTLDMIGGSSYLWDWKHNTMHHTYPNIDGHDDDINVGLLGRLSPHQKRLKIHRLQGIYLWLLYGFLALKWHLFDDFYNVASGHMGGRKIRRPQGKDLAIFIGGKVVFFSLAFGIPMLLHPVWAVLTIYAASAFCHRCGPGGRVPTGSLRGRGRVSSPDRYAGRRRAYADRVGRTPGADDRGFRTRQSLPVLVAWVASTSRSSITCSAGSATSTTPHCQR
jgi:linoleoyl-CoA desaturase